MGVLTLLSHKRVQYLNGYKQPHSAALKPGVMKKNQWITFLLCIILGTGKMLQAQPGFISTRTYQGQGYYLWIPANAFSHPEKLKLLVMVHGTNGDAREYMDYPRDLDDDTKHNLLILAPQFPRESEDNKWSRYDNKWIGWLYALIHYELKFRTLPRLGLPTAYTEKFYLFGHSKGGQFVQSYIMKYKGNDIIKAASCASGIYYNREGLSGSMSSDDYTSRMRHLVKTNLAIIVGSTDCTCGNGDGGCKVGTNGDQWADNNCVDGNDRTRDKWERIKLAIAYFNNKLYSYLGLAYLRSIIRQPPEKHPVGATFTINTWAGKPEYPVAGRKVRFFWTPNKVLDDGSIRQGHRGKLNYVTARKYFFADYNNVPQPEVSRSPIQPVEASFNLSLSFPETSTVDDRKITYTTNGTEPNFSSTEFDPWNTLPFQINRSTRIKAKIFNRIPDAEGTRRSGPVMVADYGFINSSIAIPEFYKNGRDDYNDDYIVKTRIPEGYQLGTNAFLWYNIDSETPPAHLNLLSEGRDVLYPGRIRFSAPGTYTIRARYYLKNETNQVFEPGPASYTAITLP